VGFHTAALEAAGGEMTDLDKIAALREFIRFDLATRHSIGPADYATRAHVERAAKLLADTAPIQDEAEEHLRADVSLRDRLTDLEVERLRLQGHLADIISAKDRSGYRLGEAIEAARAYLTAQRAGKE
jgi:hypothetical protein